MIASQQGAAPRQEQAPGPDAAPGKETRASGSCQEAAGSQDRGQQSPAQETAEGLPCEKPRRERKRTTEQSTVQRLARLVVLEQALEAPLVRATRRVQKPVRDGVYLTVEELEALDEALAVPREGALAVVTEESDSSDEELEVSDEEQSGSCLQGSEDGHGLSKAGRSSQAKPDAEQIGEEVRFCQTGRPLLHL